MNPRHRTERDVTRAARPELAGRRFLGLLLGALALTGLLVTVAARSEEAPPQSARVTYLSASTVYVDAGTDAGLAPGQEIRVVRDGAPIATLEVVELSTRRAACRILEAGEAIQVGDTVSFVAEAPASVGLGADAEPEAVLGREAPVGPPAPSFLRRLGLRGHVGLGWLSLRDQTGFGSDLDRPSLDLRVRGERVGGTQIGLEADVRARRSTLTRASGEESVETTNRVYRMNASWRAPNGSGGVVLGRQYSPALSVVNLFDGISAELSRERWSLGGLTGWLPDPENLGLSDEIREHGVYAQWRNGPGELARWELTSGLLGSYTRGEVDREFLYLQGRYGNARWFGFASQEIDFNRSWKSDAGESAVSPTATQIMLRMRASEEFDLSAGFDNRRRVRLYRDRETPETEFDDQYRQGLWAGARWRPLRDYGAGLRVQTRTGGTSSSADAVTLDLDARPSQPGWLWLGSRTTLYQNDLLDGWLQTLRLGIAAIERIELHALGGWRDESSRAGDLLGGQESWIALDVDVTLRPELLLLVSWEHQFQSDEAVDQTYLTLGWRF